MGDEARQHSKKVTDWLQHGSRIVHIYWHVPRSQGDARLIPQDIMFGTVSGFGGPQWFLMGKEAATDMDIFVPLANIDRWVPDPDPRPQRAKLT